MATDPYNNEGPRGFVRVYIDLEPDLSDWASKAARERGMSKRAFLRVLIINEKAKETPSGKSKK